MELKKGTVLKNSMAEAARLQNEQSAAPGHKVLLGRANDTTPHHTTRHDTTRTNKR